MPVTSSALGPNRVTPREANAEPMMIAIVIGRNARPASIGE
jgi:hypothetical protein